MVFAFLIIGIVLIALSLFGGVLLSVWSGINSLISAVAAVVFLLLALVIWAIKNFYVKPSANEAYVITGMGGRRVLIDQGGLFIPIVQQLVPVSLETMKLEVERLGADALITKDNLRVDVRAEFYIKVLPDSGDVINAARSLGEKSVTAGSVSNLVFEKLVSALRSVAATKDLVEIHAQRDEFASAVQTLVTSDLEQNGLTLESVTISRFDQTDQAMLSDNNIFDAQGKRKITEITQSALVERNRIEQEALREITMKNVQTRKETLELERDQAQAEAVQHAEVAKVQADRLRDAETYQIEQSRQVEEARIAQEEAVKRRSIERDRELIDRQKDLETGDIERLKAIELAERRKQVEIAEAEKLHLEAQAAREEAQEKIVTVQRLAEAEREAQTKLIAAKQRIEEDRFKQETEATVEAFAEVRRAEAQRQSAGLEAEAVLARAQADSESKVRLALGETALKRVEVDIEREKVEVETARVEVERQALENREKYSQAALEFEVQKLRIEASRDVQKELAKAISEFMSRGNMQIFGSPETMSNMMSQYAKGMGIGQMLDGVMDNTEFLKDGRVQELLMTLQQMRTGNDQSSAPSAQGDD